MNLAQKHMAISTLRFVKEKVDPLFESSKEADQQLSDVVCSCDGCDTLHRMRLVA